MKFARPPTLSDKILERVLVNEITRRFTLAGFSCDRDADKAARTVVLLTERLDHHRGRGQQQITVKHVTTNNVTADQAIITDSVTTGGAPCNVASPVLLAASSEAPMPILDEARLPDPVGVGEVPKPNEHQPHAKRPRRTSVPS